jgi:hypothetical protein
VAQHPTHSFGFVITVHIIHPVAQSIIHKAHVATHGKSTSG